MRTVWQSLLWKEWHEHKWKLAAVSLLALFVPILFYQGELILLPTTISVALLSYSLIVGVFFGMDVAGGENGRGTMQFLQTLPVSMQRPALTKLVAALLTATLPIFLTVGASYLYIHSISLDDGVLAKIDDVANIHMATPFGDWGFGGWYVPLILNCVLLTASLLLWMAAVGVNQSDEIRAGAIGFLVIVVIWGVLILSAYYLQRAGLDSFGKNFATAVATMPGGAAFIGKFHNSAGKNTFPLLIALAVASHACVFAWYLRRFGHTTTRPAKTKGNTPTTSLQTNWLAPPRRSQLTALIWKQTHETGPLALVGAGSVFAMTLLFFLLGEVEQSKGEFGSALAGITLGMGFLVTLVAGIGVFLDDLKPKVGIFWRSRPTNLALWFGVKYVTGLAVIGAVFGCLLLIAISFSFPNNFDPRDLALQATFAALIFGMIYTLAMLTYCLIRQPVIAAVATIGLFFVGVHAFNRVITSLFDARPHLSVGLGVFLLLQVLVTALAWLAVRNDWGWQK